MTDLRTRLADAVMDGVGADEHDAYQVADVLLSLPGVVIVDADELQQRVVASVRADLLIGDCTPGFLRSYFLDGVKDSVADGIRAAAAGAEPTK